MTERPPNDVLQARIEELEKESRRCVQAEQRLQWESAVNAALAELSQALISPLSVDEISLIVLEQAKRLTGSAFGYVGYIDPKTGYLVAPTLSRDIWDACQVADKDIVFKQFVGLWGWVLHHRQSLLTNDPSHDPRSTGTPDGHVPIDRFLSAPAIINGTLVGQVAVANPSRDYTADDLAVVERLASLYSLAVERKRVEGALQEKSRELAERVKELNCLYRIARLREGGKESLKDIAQGVVEILPSSWQYPERTGARVIFRGQEFKTENFRVTPWKLTAPLVVHGEHAGVVEVCLLDSPTEEEERPFLEEEQGLLNAVAERLGRIIEHREADEARHASEERNRLLVETMHEGLAIQDEEGKVSVVNDRLCRMLRCHREDLLGRPLEELLGHACPELKGVLAGRKEEAPTFFEALLVSKDGSEVRATISAQPLFDSAGGFKGSFAIFTDITELKMLRQRVQIEDGFEGMVGRDVAMLDLFDLIRKAAAYDYPVLVQGESGVGKELVALAIHNLSQRAGGRFLPVNCGALPEGLLESELFGHVKGAFTGAIRDKKGRFELADGGTIFLDEVGELTPATQVKLLRTLQEGTVERVGGEQVIKVNVRVISATNKDLRKLVAAGRFREDLYYRLCVVPINVPALRERPGDIPLLIEHFVQRFTKKVYQREISLSPQAMAQLVAYSWPGNVRELQNVIQFALVNSGGERIELGHLPATVRRPTEIMPRERLRKRKLDETSLAEAIKSTRGNKKQAAKLLGVSRATLYRCIREFRIPRQR